MSKKLIITEKPSVARDFAQVLKVNGRQNGYIENNEYVISWCYGHLVEMAYPEVYDPKYKSWKLEDLPFLPKEYKYSVVESAKEQYHIVNGLLHREDIDTVYWAGDSGKEGQTIEENIRMYGGVREGMTELRVWIDSQTDEDILNGIRDAKPMSDYALLGKSGIMRTIEDYSLGINFSRALSVKYGRLINDAAATKSYTAIAIGRVMTCVLGMVVNREREIRNFKDTPFFRINGLFSDNTFYGEWKSIEGTKYFESPLLYKENGFKRREDAEKFIESLTGKKAVIENAESFVSKKKAPLLFNLAEIQSECSKIFKISPAQTLQIVQDLYERKYTTYPRTDARVLTTSVAKEITKNLRGLNNYEKYSDFVKEILDGKKYIGLEKTIYTDDSKVTDHYAIIPTGFVNNIGSLDDIHKSVYELIVRRFLSIFYPPAEYDNGKIEIVIDGEYFYSSAKKLAKPGYMKVAGTPKDTDDNSDDDNINAKDAILTLAKNAKSGEEISVKGFEVKEGKTSPPKRYTSGNLILAMENAGNLIEDEELRQQIKRTGIGTSATRGEILDKLVRIAYLNQNNKTQIITPSNLGEMIYEVVYLTVPTLLNPEMTASWEKGLEGIVNGSVDDVEYRKKLEDYIRTETNKMVSLNLTGQIAANINPFTGKDAKGAAARKPLGIKCPVCGGELTTTPFGYGCSNYFNKENPCKFSVGEIAGKTISEEDFKKLISEGKTDIIDGFKSKKKMNFKAALKLSQDENGAYSVGFDFEDVKPEIMEGVLCPACGNNIVSTPFGVSCEKKNRDGTGCYFSIGQIADHKLTDDEIRLLLTEKKTDVIKGFKSKNKKTFSAKLVLKEVEGKQSVAFDFDDIEPDTLKDVVCPDCGGAIQIRGTNFGCANYNPEDSESCKFFIGTIANKNLSVSNVTELLKEGKTKTIRGFKGKSGKKFDACLVLKKNEEGKSEIAFDFENVEAQVLKDAKCPVCGGDIVKTSFGYGCKNYNREDPDNSCKFNIGTIASVKLNDGQVKALLNDGVTPLIGGFKSKAGKKFDAKLALSKDDEGKVTGIHFVFENEDEVIDGVTCPKCGGKLIKGHQGYRCEHYTREDNGCKFFVGKICNVLIDKEQFVKLINDKKTDVINGFVSSKTNNSFDTALILDEENTVKFAFAVENNAQESNTENDNNKEKAD